MDEVIDRRILDQVRQLQKLGNRVFIAALGNQTRLFELAGAPTVLTSHYLLNLTHKDSIEIIAGLKGQSEFRESIQFSDPDEPKWRTRLNLAAKAKKFLKRVLPTWVKILIINSGFMYRGSHLLRNSRTPFWINSGVTLSQTIEINNVDIFVGVDLPGAVAAFLKSKKHPHSLFWFDAHEYYSQQSFLNGLMDVKLANEIELKLINEADVFTTVSESLLQHILIESGRQGPSFTLNNSTPHLSLRQVPPTSIKSLFPNKKVLLFHGGLSDVRGITNLARNFTTTNHPDWVLAFIGYWPSSELIQMIESNDSIHLFEPVSVDLMHERIFGVDAIIIPYPGESDMNTKYCFPNKLGDAIALRTPIIYDSSLIEIDNLNQKFQLGLSCNLHDKSHGSLGVALNAVSRLIIDWERIETEIGWTHNEEVISQILSQKEIWFS